MRVFTGIVIFTAVELVSLTVWLLLLVPSIREVALGTQILAAVFLFVTLLIEHIIATNVGRRRPLLDISD